MFPAGKYPLFNDSYGTAKCFIVPLSEKRGIPIIESTLAASALYGVERQEIFDSER